jgi:hypothetical protein
MLRPIPIFNSPLLSISDKKVLVAKTEELRALQRQTAENIIKMGQILIDVKDLLPQGQFEDYLELEFGQNHGYTQRSAQNFMNVARQFGGKKVTYSIAPSVLYLLAAPSVPDSVRTEAIELAESGEKISVDRAKAMVTEAKVALIEEAVSAPSALVPDVKAAEYRECEVIDATDPDLLVNKPPEFWDALPTEIEEPSTLPDQIWQPLSQICPKFDLSINDGDRSAVPCLQWLRGDEAREILWKGSIFLDLSRQKSPEIFVNKLFEPSEIRLMVVLANLSYDLWFHSLGYSAGAICFVRSKPQALFYIGPSYGRFIEIFQNVGLVARSV